MGMRGQPPSRLGGDGPAAGWRRGWWSAAATASRLTETGYAEAAGSVVRKHRLWELYLTRRLELAHDHVHRDAEAMEHALTDADVDRLDGAPGAPGGPTPTAGRSRAGARRCDAAAWPEARP